MINHIKKWIQKIAEEKTEKILKEEIEKIKNQWTTFEKHTNEYVQNEITAIASRQEKNIKMSERHMLAVENYLKSTHDLIQAKL